MTRPTSTRLTLLAIFGALALSACGVKGTLKTPPPLFGGEKTEPKDDQSSDDTKNEADAETKDTDDDYPEYLDY